MSVTLEYTDGTKTTYNLVDAAPGRVQFDTPTYRGAVSEAWRSHGTGDVNTVPMRLRFHTFGPERNLVYFDSEIVTFNSERVYYSDSTNYAIADSATRADEVLANIQAAVLIDTNWGAWRLAGIRSMTDQPTALGYVSTVQVELINPRYASSSNALRLIDGTLWELR